MKVCAAEGCDRGIHRREWCSLHYQRWLAHGDVTVNLQPGNLICEIEGCEDPVRSRGWCSRHYMRWYRTGVTSTVRRPPMTFPDNFLRRLLFCPPTTMDTGCVEFTGTRLPTGYGNLGVGGRKVYAHRAAYEMVKGDIPDGMEVDHLCRNRSCVHPGHLEAVTHAENMRRGLAHRTSP